MDFIVSVLEDHSSIKHVHVVTLTQGGIIKFRKALIFFPLLHNLVHVNQKLLYRESDWWYVGLVVQKARKQGTVC